MDSNIAVAFGEVVRVLRKAAGMSQEKLALATDLQRKHVCVLEGGKKTPSLPTVLAIARGLNIEPGALVSLVADKINELHAHSK